MGVVEVSQALKHAVCDGANDRDGEWPVLAINVIQAPAMRKGAMINCLVKIQPGGRSHPLSMCSMQMQM